MANFREGGEKRRFILRFWEESLPPKEEQHAAGFNLKPRFLQKRIGVFYFGRCEESYSPTGHGMANFREGGESADLFCASGRKAFLPGNQSAAGFNLKPWSQKDWGFLFVVKWCVLHRPYDGRL